MNKEYYRTADEEEPNCGVCDNMDTCNGKNCGPENGWARYGRWLSKEELQEYEEAYKGNY